MSFEFQETTICHSQIISDTHHASNNDSVIITNCIKGFFTWYKSNYSKANDYRLVGTDDNGYYFVDKKVCEKYLRLLKSSKFLSDNYLSAWRKYFEERTQNFKNNPQNEGPPEGFDYDLVTSTQEPDLVYDAVDRLNFKIVEIADKKAVVQMIGEWTFSIKLSKVRGKWLIDEIEII